MNNSLKRMCEGMAATLRNEVIPQLGSEFARGQAFGVIYMLNSIALRADWSPGFVGAQLAAQYELIDRLKPLLAGLDAPEPPRMASANLIACALETVRDENDARICALIEWMADHGSTMDAARAAAIETALRGYMNQQLKLELDTSAKPMFAEMSSGSE